MREKDELMKERDEKIKWISDLEELELNLW